MCVIYSTVVLSKKKNESHISLLEIILLILHIEDKLHHK